MTSGRMDRVVVVGHGIAGLTACDALRAGGYDGGLTIVGDECHAPYSRPALSKAMLRDDADIVSHRLPGPTHGATELLGVTAARLDVDRRIVYLDDGGDLPYDRLVIATGSRARKLSDGASELGCGEFTLRNLDDALALRHRLADSPSVIVVGGGPLGMEIASGCLAAGCAVTLISDVPPLTPHLGRFLSEVLTTAALEHGLELIVTGSVSRVVDRSGKAAVVTPDGKVFEADLVVTAAGDIPNVGWLASTGLLTGGALQVDSRARLRPDIVAAGDAVAFPTRRGVRRLPFWSSAIEQAKVAAGALLFEDDADELGFQPYFWTEQFGLSLKACGELPVDGDPVFSEGASAAGPALMTWTHNDGTGTAVAMNYRISIPKLRRLAAGGSRLR